MCVMFEIVSVNGTTLEPTQLVKLTDILKKIANGTFSLENPSFIGADSL